MCINDNIQNKTESHDKIIHDFYNSFFPLPSQFEKNHSDFWNCGLCVDLIRIEYFWKQSRQYVGKLWKLEWLVFSGMVLVCAVIAWRGM